MVSRVCKTANLCSTGLGFVTATLFPSYLSAIIMRGNKLCTLSHVHFQGREYRPMRTWRFLLLITSAGFMVLIGR